MLQRRSSRTRSKCIRCSAVQDICNKNYMEICDSMDKVITMKRDMTDMSVVCSSE